MNVKQQIFEKTKETILKNKLQFLQQQLKQSHLRKDRLSDQNTTLKAQIRFLKTEQTFKSKKKQASILNSSQYDQTTSSNQSMMKTIGNNKKSELKLKQNLFFETGDVSNKQNNQQFLNRTLNQVSQDELEKFQAKLRAYYKEKMKQLQEKEKKLVFLKQKCEHQNNIEAHETALENFAKNKAKQMKQKSRKTVSINLVNSISQRNTESFNKFPEKDKNSNNYHQRKSNNSAAYSIKLCEEPTRHPERSSSGRHKQYGCSSLNASLIYTKREDSRKLAYSRASSSKMINLSRFNMNRMNDSMNCSKMSNNSLNSSLIGKNKSYSKVITSLECEGCGFSFKPNLYYRHIDQCRQYIKLQLQRQRDEIDEKINQTLNFSINYP